LEHGSNPVVEHLLFHVGTDWLLVEKALPVNPFHPRRKNVGPGGAALGPDFQREVEGPRHAPGTRHGRVERDDKAVRAAHQDGGGVLDLEAGMVARGSLGRSADELAPPYPSHEVGHVDKVVEQAATPRQ